MAVVVFYVSGHGFGHAVRMAEVVKELRRIEPRVKVHVRTMAPQMLFPPDVEVSRPAGDCSVVQRDAMEFDRGATLRAAQEFQVGHDWLVGQEEEFLRAVEASVVVTDIPWHPLPAARRIGARTIAVGNFSWDWVYAYFERAENGGGVGADGLDYGSPLVRGIRDDYAEAELALRLPFHGDLSAFRQVRDLPMIARLVNVDRREARRRLGLPDQVPVVLLGFGGFSVRSFNADALVGLADYIFLAVEPMPPLPEAPNTRWFLAGEVPYLDLLAAADVVVTKPGYGVVTDCLANRVRVLYTDRGDFPEYPLLVRALEELGTAMYVPQRDLLRAHLRPYLRSLLEKPPFWADLPKDGAAVAAAFILGQAE